MKFKLDNAKDCERLARVVASLQHEGVKFHIYRHMNPAGELSDYAEIRFGAE